MLAAKLNMVRPQFVIAVATGESAKFIDTEGLLTSELGKAGVYQKQEDAAAVMQGMIPDQPCEIYVMEVKLRPVEYCFKG